MVADHFAQEVLGVADNVAAQADTRWYINSAKYEAVRTLLFIQYIV